MEYTERMQNVSVLGAAGKMGSGILLLTALEMADQMLNPANKGKTFVLNAIDTSNEGLAGLLKYIRSQVIKAAEKKMVPLRKLYAEKRNLIENEEIIQAYVQDVMGIIRPTTRLESTFDSFLIFEAVSENQALKEKIFTLINTQNPHKPWFFTNTSSIPIKILDANSKLEGRILGFHFYNPPAIQKLVELITIEQNPLEMKEFAGKYASNLRKVLVPSNDIAGFIGNGHFMRDAIYGISEAERLSKLMPLHEAIYCIDKVTRDYLGRPMGIFQLIDYVGLDVVQFILRVMQPYMVTEDLHSSLIDEFVLAGIKGGQYSDGSQKDGFLKYEKGKPIAVVEGAGGKYVEIAGFKEKCDAWLGEFPSGMLPWKNLVKAPDKKKIMEPAFATMANSGSEGGKLAIAYARKSRDIANGLVQSGVAQSADDVNTVLLTGFFHAYGPINDYL